MDGWMGVGSDLLTIKGHDLHSGLEVFVGADRCSVTAASSDTELICEVCLRLCVVCCVFVLLLLCRNQQRSQPIFTVMPNAQMHKCTNAMQFDRHFAFDFYTACCPFTQIPNPHPTPKQQKQQQRQKVSQSYSVGPKLLSLVTDSNDTQELTPESGTTVVPLHLESEGGNEEGGYDGHVQYSFEEVRWWI